MYDVSTIKPFIKTDSEKKGQMNRTKAKGLYQLVDNDHKRKKGKERMLWCI